MQKTKQKKTLAVSRMYETCSAGNFKVWVRKTKKHVIIVEEEEEEKMTFAITKDD